MRKAVESSLEAFYAYLDAFHPNFLPAKRRARSKHFVRELVKSGAIKDQEETECLEAVKARFPNE